jgi:PAS domain S-box-containing protein
MPTSPESIDIAQRYLGVFTRFMLAPGEFEREAALFEATELGKRVLDASKVPALDQIIDLHRQTQSTLAHAWSQPDTGEEGQAARARLALGETMPLLLALMVPHELALRRQHEQRWRQEHGKLAAMAEQTDDLIVVLDARGRIEELNPAFTRLSGWHRHEASDSTAVWRTPLPTQATEHLRAEQLRRDGSVYLAEWSVSPIFGPQGQLLNHICIGRDVTHQQQIEEGLRENDKLRAVATLAAGIAHDFNNLLGSILGLTDLCELEAPPGSIQATNLVGIKQASRQAAALVRQMLDFSRQTPRVLQALGVAEWLTRTDGLLRAALPPSIGLALRVDADAPVRIDLVQMEQVLLNITLNAAHAMRRQGGVVQIVADLATPAGADQAQARIRISDQGEGMAPEVLGKVFEPFFTTKPVGEGTGLGLAAAHGIVSNHGGHIEVSSEPGVGSTFSVFLPLADEALAAPTRCAPVRRQQT